MELQVKPHFGDIQWKQGADVNIISSIGLPSAKVLLNCPCVGLRPSDRLQNESLSPRRVTWPPSAHPLVFGSDDELLVLLGHHAAGAVGGLQHVDDQVVGQDVQLLHVVPRHVHWARQALPEWTDQSAASVITRSQTHTKSSLARRPVTYRMHPGALWTLIISFSFKQCWFVSGYVTPADDKAFFVRWHRPRYSTDTLKEFHATRKL